MTIIFIEKEVFILIINLNILSKPKKITEIYINIA